MRLGARLPVALLATAIVLVVPSVAPAKQGRVPGQYIVTLQDDADIDAFLAERPAGTVLATYRSVGHGYAVRFAKGRVARGLADLRADPRVRAIEQDQYVALSLS